MARRRYTADQVRALIREQISKLGSQKALAERIGISQAFLSDVLLGRRDPSGPILDHLGLVREINYVEKRP